MGALRGTRFRSETRQGNGNSEGTVYKNKTRQVDSALRTLVIGLD